MTSRLRQPIKRKFSPDNARVDEIAKSDLLFTLPVSRAMKHFHISHEGLKQAQVRAREQRPEAQIERLIALRAVKKVFSRLVRAEVKYPRLHRLIARGDTHPEIAERFGISRARVFQLNDLFSKMAKRLNEEPSAVVSRVEKEARDVDGR